jgi:hypothetical protein
VTTAKKEHIAAFITPSGVGSLLAGVGPADVHNRDPRELPLVSGGARAVGNGVLALADDANAVLCQLVPSSVLRAPGDSPEFSVRDEDAVEGAQSALVIMGSAPWGQFGQKVKAGQIGTTYTFAAVVKAVGEAGRVRLEVERAGRPWDRVIRGEDRELRPDEWTEVHVTFRVEKSYPEDWSAYIHCSQPGARLRADMFRLYQGDEVPQRVGAGGGGNLFANPSFEAGPEPWFFRPAAEQQNLRKTFRRASFLLARLLANMGVRGETPLLSRFSTPASGPPRGSVVRNGDMRLDADGDGMPDHWQFITDAKQATCTLEEGAPNTAPRCLRIACPGFAEGKQASLMLAQHNVPVEAGQWYLISFMARSEGLKGARVTLALQDTTTWRSLFEYQRFAPREAWREFTFLVQADGAAAARTRFQIWHGAAGTLWLSDIHMAPCDPPTEGRWTSGLYLDTPQEWDDPYRFFRW